MDYYASKYIKDLVQLLLPHTVYAVTQDYEMCHMM